VFILKSFVDIVGILNLKVKTTSDMVTCISHVVRRTYSMTIQSTTDALFSVLLSGACSQMVFGLVCTFLPKESCNIDIFALPHKSKTYQSLVYPSK
jgi:hypothetical protein